MKLGLSSTTRRDVRLEAGGEAETKQDIFQVAAMELATTGSAKLDVVAHAAGVDEALVRRHFEDESDLLREIATLAPASQVVMTDESRRGPRSSKKAPRRPSR